jgi:ribonuclease HII
MITASLDYERILWNQGHEYVVGIDEVGRGCFAGPLVAAAVILPKSLVHTYDITDSKLLSHKKRVELEAIIRKIALFFTIVEVDLDCINKNGIGIANQHAFNKLLANLKRFDHILMDGFSVKSYPLDKQTILVKGDQKSVSIASASIIAKVYRDNLMTKLHSNYPVYNFRNNKGYGTQEHREAIKKFGLSELHRSSFLLEKFL